MIEDNKRTEILKTLDLIKTSKDEAFSKYSNVESIDFQSFSDSIEAFKNNINNIVDSQEYSKIFSEMPRESAAEIEKELVSAINITNYLKKISITSYDEKKEIYKLAYEFESLDYLNSEYVYNSSDFIDTIKKLILDNTFSLTFIKDLNIERKDLLNIILDTDILIKHAILYDEFNLTETEILQCLNNFKVIDNKSIIIINTLIKGLKNEDLIYNYLNEVDIKLNFDDNNKYDLWSIIDGSISDEEKIADLLLKNIDALSSNTDLSYKISDFKNIESIKRIISNPTIFEKNISNYGLGGLMLLFSRLIGTDEAYYLVKNKNFDNPTSCIYFDDAVNFLLNFPENSKLDFKKTCEELLPIVDGRKYTYYDRFIKNYHYQPEIKSQRNYDNFLAIPNEFFSLENVKLTKLIFEEYLNDSNIELLLEKKLTIHFLSYNINKLNLSDENLLKIFKNTDVYPFFNNENIVDYIDDFVNKLEDKTLVSTFINELLEKVLDYSRSKIINEKIASQIKKLDNIDLSLIPTDVFLEFSEELQIEYFNKKVLELNDENFDFFCNLKDIPKLEILKNIKVNQNFNYSLLTRLLSDEIKLQFLDYTNAWGNVNFSSSNVTDIITSFTEDKNRMLAYNKAISMPNLNSFSSNDLTNIIESFKEDENRKNFFYDKIMEKIEIVRKISWEDLLNIVESFSKEKSLEIYEKLEEKGILIRETQIVREYLKIEELSIKEIFKKYIRNNYDNLDLNKIGFLSDILYKLSYSNASELVAFKINIAEQLLNSDNPMKYLIEIENIFLKNNIPIVGKAFSVFNILHQNFNNFDFSLFSMISPVLKKHSNYNRKIIIFSDLLRASLGSNNRSLREYLDNIEEGNKLFLQINKGEISFESLDEKSKKVFSIFVSHLNTLYNNTAEGKNNGGRELSGDIMKDAKELYSLFLNTGNINYDLPDRIVRMFGHFAGFDTFEQMKNYMIIKREQADLKNREFSKAPLVLENGDFVKGIGEVKYLSNILQNGSVAKEFLGSSAKSDSTPLDTDLSMIKDLPNSLSEMINSTASSTYGPIWIVLKNDERNRFITTRQELPDIDIKADEISNLIKLEVFYNGAVARDHYGIRTGFASSEIDYIVTSDYIPEIGLEIAMNGFYIPVVDKETENLLFSEKDYDNIRKKMEGLSHFELNDYSFASSTYTPEIEYFLNQMEENKKETNNKRTTVIRSITNVMREFGLECKDKIDGNLEEGSFEFIDTGSTGRGTNLPLDSDFDFMMRLDKKIMENPQKLISIKNALLQSMGKSNTKEVTYDGDFRLKNVKIDGLEEPVKIDITFITKTDKLIYSTEMALEDRYNSIKSKSEKEYYLTIANILLAKQTLKQAEVYKPDRGDYPQGGLGGVGVENWILQNGGSFESAAREFLSNAQGKTFEEFKESYFIWDFGQNYLADKRDIYPYDNFVNNMSREGYDKMKEVLTNYLEQIKDNSILLPTEELSEAENTQASITI